MGPTFEQWDAQYDGLVTVRYSLEGRFGRDLDVPGYTLFVGGGQVDVDIEVDASGRVVSAALVGTRTTSCFGAAALRSAKGAQFNASSRSGEAQAGG